MKVFWTAFAESQLDSIYEYIQAISPYSAKDIYNDILDESAMLARFPRMAPIEPLLSQFSKEYRSLVIRRNYKVVYYIDCETTIYIVAVFDCRQNPEELQCVVNNPKNF